MAGAQHLLKQRGKTMVKKWQAFKKQAQKDRLKKLKGRLNDKGDGNISS